MGWYDYSYYKPYVSVGQRIAKAKREMDKLRKKGQTITPVQIVGMKIATTFWGKAWCTNLESYSDYSNRLPRGRSYVRNGSVCDLQIQPGRIKARVSGSELYTITIKIKPLPAATWEAVKKQCAGQIGSLVELLQGKLSKSVMEVVTRRDGGLFPKPAEIDLGCSCPDWADMCKHVAAAMYGVGARLDLQPELLFTLRQVDHLELITSAAAPASLAQTAGDAKTIAADDLADVFGIEMDVPAEPPASASVEPAPAVSKAPARRLRAAAKTKPGRKRVAHPGKSAESGRKSSRKVIDPAKAPRRARAKQPA